MSSTLLSPSPRTTRRGFTSPSTYRVTAPADDAAPRVAREFVRAILARDIPALVDDARLCTSDAVTAVLRHTTGAYLHVDVSVLARRVVVSVGDSDRTGVLNRRDLRKETSGLSLVRRLSAASGVSWSWDAHRRTVITRVWFTLETGLVSP
ncbi:ATP-binding protein [Streptomyces luteireticuli]|uniref:ATP-binding protein n=1 Tax=Streptomyces luteireticuli TaxID=173858 RepID=UPI0035587479